MRCQGLGFVALLALGLQVHATFVHVDVSRDGDVAVDVDMKRKVSARPERQQSGKPIYPPRKTAHVLEDYQVDLEYEIHAGFPSESGKFLKFKNIPYAEPPVNGSRFLPPTYLSEVRETVNDGSQSYICPQAEVGWVPKAMEFLMDFPNLNPENDKWRERITPENYGPIEYPEKESKSLVEQTEMFTNVVTVSEDCLTLDVMVPKTVWDKRNSRGLGAAVVVWIHGGGFVYGWKDQYGSPEGLFDAASLNDEQNIIYVAMNYRLGAFGWLGGPKFQDHGGVPNLGLLDQEFALKWVREHIWKFGGSSMRITMMGQSAGASSIMHHITAYGGSKAGTQPPILGAILQSPGFFPQPNSTLDDVIYSKFLDLTGASDVDALLEIDTKILQDANAIMVHESLYGYFNFGPTIDYDYVPDLPGKLLTKDNFPVPAMLLGHTMYDGLFFTPPWIRNTSALLDHVRELFPSVPQSVLNNIRFSYPIIGGLGPQLALLGVSDFLDDIAIQCNNYYLTEAALKSNWRSFHPVYRYVFNALPAIHGYDTGYTYYPSPPLIPKVDVDLAKYFQETIVNFVRYLDPNPENSTLWEEYGTNNRKVMNMGKPVQPVPESNYEYSLGPDLLNRLKCNYWQSAPYYAPGSTNDATFVVQDEKSKEDL